MYSLPVFGTLMIEPEVSGSKQLDEGIADTLISDDAGKDVCLMVLGDVAMRERVRSRPWSLV